MRRCERLFAKLRKEQGRSLWRFMEAFQRYNFAEQVARKTQRWLRLSITVNSKKIMLLIHRSGYYGITQFLPCVTSLRYVFSQPLHHSNCLQFLSRKLQCAISLLICHLEELSKISANLQSQINLPKYLHIQ